jgi:hypothetical protein
MAMREMAISVIAESELDALVETNAEILDQVRADLNQEYTRFMGRLLMEGLAKQPGGETSILARLRKASPPPEPSGSP